MEIFTIKYYITEFEKRNKFLKKRTVQNLYTSMTEECMSITSSTISRQYNEYSEAVSKNEKTSIFESR